MLQVVKATEKEEYVCLLTKTSSCKHKTIVKTGNDKSRLKKHVLTHHKGLNLISYESKSSNSRTAKEVDSLIEDYNKNGASLIENFFETKPKSANPPERDFALWVMAAKVPFYQLQGPLFNNFLHAIPKLLDEFNPREVVYRQMELIKAETLERMNEFLEGVDFVDTTGDTWNKQ